MMKGAPKWLQIALEQLGVKEIAGPEHSVQILDYHSTTTLRADTDEVPWCSSFVNWCITVAGLIGTNSAAARSWLEWGQKIEKPITGCIVVMSRGSNPQSGHVGFFIEEVNHGKHINILGGNQSDMVKLETYPVDRVLAYIWPEEEIPKKSNKTKSKGTFGSKI